MTTPSGLSKKIHHCLLRIANVFPGSKDYWERRYASGGTSGSGSYGILAKFKADFLNGFVKEKKIKSVIEFGCGDSNQIKLFKFPKYLGVDVSETAISICQKQFSKDKNKSFFLYAPKHFDDSAKFVTADLALSLDVIYHLVEDEVFELHMHHLFNASQKYVIVYSSSTDSSQQYHVKARDFKAWISQNYSEWKLIHEEKNKYPKLSWANFYVYKKS